MFCLKKNGQYQNFYPSREAVHMCCSKADRENVVEVEILENNEGEFWCWRNKDGNLSMVYPSLLLLGLCFPYGVKAAEEAGNGKAIRVNVREVETTTVSP